MKKFFFLTMAALFLAAASVVVVPGASKAVADVCHWGSSCPICDMSGYWTGDTKVEWGRLMKLYKCAAGHYWWQHD